MFGQVAQSRARWICVVFVRFAIYFGVRRAQANPSFLARRWTLEAHRACHDHRSQASSVTRRERGSCTGIAAGTSPAASIVGRSYFAGPAPGCACAGS
jgi:hypothetical protein